MAAQKGIGRLIQVGIGKETTRGTLAGGTVYWTPWNDLTLDEKKEFAIDAQSYGVIEDSVQLTQTKAWAQGSIAGNILDQSFGLILYSMFGTLTSHAAHSGETTVYDNIFNIQEGAQHQSLSFFTQDPLSAVNYSYVNGVVEKLEINMALKKFVEYTASIRALSGSTGSFSPSILSENRFVAQHLTAKFALNSAGLAGTLTATGTASSTVHVTACSINPQTNLKVGMTVTGTNIPANTTVAKIVSATAYDLSAATTGAIGTQTFGPIAIQIKSAKLTINANVEDQDVLGSVNPADFLNKEFAVEGTLEAIWQNNSDFKDQFMGPYPLAILLDIKNTDVSIGVVPSNPELQFNMPKCTIQELGRPFKVKDLVYQNIKFKAVYSVSDALMLKATLTNSVNGY